jgi:5-formyltetrahydrofolate cyclo-ligase
LSKAELRQLMLARRRALAPATRAQWDREIGAKVVRWWRESGVGALGVYWPLRDEPDLQACYAELAQLGVQLCWKSMRRWRSRSGPSAKRW